MKCYVTRCSLLELKALGAPLSGNYTALTALMKLHIVSVQHLKWKLRLAHG